MTVDDIYALCCPTTGEVRYIGKASNAARRFAGHLREVRRKTPVYCWIESLRKQGKTPTLRVLMSSWDWKGAERDMIAQYRAEGARLLNLADGGDQPACSVEQRRANAVSLNTTRAADPLAFATHAFLRHFGQMVRYARQNKDDALAARLEAKLLSCKRMDKDWLAYQLWQSERLRRFFPKGFHVA